ncbi:hypothetical protein P5G65_33870 [Paenibacillus chondroitinus]|uniref:Uncharacterized protein n=1 Tax=Paenibacillus chondroitinus TaxID=59842 RepID=A0ABU6DMN3_9BACL|nr:MULTISPECIES: hypothetical protein [Paenibacillus]MCY9661982.1 hypothetical protein [Paenibacillus anseongense]MEB4798894.1 hypothetical protein [Paenibacillus chondroitinus]
MIPKVRSVESLILSNRSSEQFAVRFRKIIFHKDAQFLILQWEEEQHVMKIKSCNGAVKLIESTKEEFDELIGFLREGYAKTSSDPDLAEEFWVVGISFNKVENNDGYFSEFRISDEKPIDILPYIIQTGVEHVFFSE